MIFERVQALIAEQLDIDPEKIEPDSSLLEDLGADSIDAVDLMLAIQEEFDLEIPEELVADIKTVNDIVKSIEDLQ